MKYGYIRDSKNNEKHLQKQREHLNNFNLDSLIREPRGIAFGEGFRTLLDKLQPGDELYVDHVIRMSKSLRDFLTILDILIEKDVALYESGELVDKKYIKMALAIEADIYGGNRNNVTHEYDEDDVEDEEIPKVYILMCRWKSEDYTYIEAVYSTLEKAEQGKKEHEDDRNWNKSKDFYYEIIECNVDEE